MAMAVEDSSGLARNVIRIADQESGCSRNMFPPVASCFCVEDKWKGLKTCHWVLLVEARYPGCYQSGLG